MTRRDEFLGTHPDFHPGMVAFSDDGQELGEVQKLDEESLTIEKGRFFSDDRRLPYDAVGDIHEDHLIINRSRVDLDEGTSDLYGQRKEADETFVPDAQPAVPIYGHDIDERELPMRDPASGEAGPMAGGETFKDEETKARTELRATSYEEAGKTATEEIDRDRERFRKK